MNGHTPGPWHQGGYEVQDDQGALICTLSGWKNTSATKANARLIAAAPELLEALKLIASCESKFPGDVVDIAKKALLKANVK